MYMLLAFIGFFMAPTFAGELDWNEIYTEDEVKVSRATVEDSRLFAFKGETVMDAEVGKVLYVLLDNDHRTEWVGRLVHNTVLEADGSFDYVIYQVFDLPAIFADRDYVYHGEATRDDVTGVVTLHMESVEHADAPETVGVRARLVNSRYRLTPLDDGRTNVEVEIITDPMGMMPVWLTNLIQKSWPLDTLNGIRGQLDKPFTGVHALPGEEAASAVEAEPEAEAAPAAEGEDAPAESSEEATPAESSEEAAPAESSEEAAPAESTEEAAPAE